MPPMAAIRYSAYTSGPSMPARRSSSPVTSDTRMTATQIVIVRNSASVSKARARDTMVDAPSSVMSSHWNIASPPAAPATSAVYAA